MSNVCYTWGTEAHPLINGNFLNSIDIIKSKYSILIIGGNIGDCYSYKYKHFISECVCRFKHVFVGAGFIEHYSGWKRGHSVEKTNAHINSICTQLPDITFLDTINSPYSWYMDYFIASFDGRNSDAFDVEYAAKLKGKIFMILPYGSEGIRNTDLDNIIIDCSIEPSLVIWV